MIKKQNVFCEFCKYRIKGTICPSTPSKMFCCYGIKPIKHLDPTLGAYYTYEKSHDCFEKNKDGQCEDYEYAVNKSMGFDTNTGDVFCVNCAYKSEHYNSSTCVHNKEPELRQYPNNEIVEYFQIEPFRMDCYTKNRNCDCPYFKEKTTDDKRKITYIRNFALHKILGNPVVSD